MNNTEGPALQAFGYVVSIDNLLRSLIYAVLGVTFLALFYMTFFHRWSPDRRLPIVEDAR